MTTRAGATPDPLPRKGLLTSASPKVVQRWFELARESGPRQAHNRACTSRIARKEGTLGLVARDLQNFAQTAHDRRVGTSMGPAAVARLAELLSMR
jgi:hypothetical protein